MNLGFGGADSGGVYHSSYDTLAWFDRFSDGDLSYGKTLSQVMTTSLLRLADAPVLPFEFGSLGRTFADTPKTSRGRRRGAPAPWISRKCRRN